MAVPEREAYVEYLRKHIPNLEVVYDTDRIGSFWMWYKIMSTIDETGGIVLEDDVVLTKDFVQKAESVVSQHPDILIQFFSMRKDDETKGPRFDGQFAMNQCVYYPPGLPGRLVRYQDEEKFRSRDLSPAPYDTMMCEAFKKWKYKFWIHVPSLVDHLVLQSMVDKRRSSKRQARVFVEPELDGFPNLDAVLNRALP